MMASTGKAEEEMLTGVCPDEKCNTTLFFPTYDSSIECTGCGQRLSKSRIKNVQPVTNHKIALHNMLKNTICGLFKPKKGPDSVKVLGVSSYQCKLLSPLLTKYGMDKTTGKAKPLSEIQSGKTTFDCSVLGGFSFVIEPEHIEVMGYGRDRTGSAIYLKDTLDSVTKFNNGEECLIPIHADGDGHCLVHAISRALTGRVLFWHALRENLKEHIVTNLDRYKSLFMDFVQDGEWQHIIEECDPKYRPLDGSVGLTNIHVFGLANVLRRPIILLDSLSGIKSSGDYSGVFLPGLCDPEDCKKAGVLNKPLCLAWSSAGRNHYIALVGVKGRCLPRLPPSMIPEVYGMPQSKLDCYVEREPDGSIVIGGGKCLTDKYILRLIAAMEELFTDIHKVSTSCVADVHQYIFKPSGYVGTDPDIVVEHTQRAVASQQLFRCITCEALSEHFVDPDWFKPGGLLYKIAIETQKTLDPTKQYSFPLHGYVCKYDDKKNILIPDPSKSQPPQCQFCQGTMMRHVRGDGTPVYLNGDRTKTRSNSTRCHCGYKHYWNGKEYDNIPEMLPLSLDWGGKTVRVTVEWFQYESDPTLNSNVYEIAQSLIEEHFPGEFGSECLMQQIVDRILKLTAKKEVNEVPKLDESQTSDLGQSSSDGWSAEVASKIILTGQQSKSICKEELTKSKTELRKNIEAKAPLMQKRHSCTAGGSTSGKSSSKEQPQKQAKTASQVRASSGQASAADQTSKQAAPSGEKNVNMSKKVRISTSDRTQITINLDASITYSQLQDLICQKFNIPPKKQKIKYGFPPKLLNPPADGSTKQPLDIQHGDKLTVEIISDEKPGSNLVDPEAAWPAMENQRSSWSTFDANARDQSAQSLLTGLDQLQNSGQDSLDTAISSLCLLASLSGKDLWHYVQSMPHLFSVGGLFYKQVERDVDLSDGKHCTLTLLPGKVFRYNAKEDRLELCLEPYGHFPVEPGIEKMVSKKEKADIHGVSSITDTQHTETSSAGSSAGLVNKTHVLPGQSSSVQAFPGQGHSLLSSCENIRMPRDLEMSPKQRSHGSANLANQTRAPVIEEEEGAEVTMEMEKAPTGGTEGKRSGRTSEFRRIGPGVTVLNNDVNNVLNEQAEKFKTLASQIESIARRASEDDDCDPDLLSDAARGVSLIPSKPLEPKTDEVISEPMDST